MVIIIIISYEYLDYFYLLIYLKNLLENQNEIYNKLMLVMTSSFLLLDLFQLNLIMERYNQYLHIYNF